MSNVHVVNVSYKDAYDQDSNPSNSDDSSDEDLTDNPPIISKPKGNIRNCIRHTRNNIKQKKFRESFLNEFHGSNEYPLSMTSNSNGDEKPMEVESQKGNSSLYDNFDQPESNTLIGKKSSNGDSAGNFNDQISIKEEPAEIHEKFVIQLSMQNIDNQSIKQENELILESDNVLCETMEEEADNLTENFENIHDEFSAQTDEKFQKVNQINMSNDSFSESDCTDYNQENSELFSIDGEAGILDDKIRFFHNRNENGNRNQKQNESSLKSSKNLAINFLNSPPTGIVVKKTIKQVACKSTGLVQKNIESEISKMDLSKKILDASQNFLITKIKEEPMKEIISDSMLKKDQIIQKSGRIVVKTGLKPSGSSLRFSEEIFGVKIKEEKMDDEEIETRTVSDLNLSGSSSLPLNQKIKEELDDYLAAGPSGLNNPSLTSNDDDSIISTKVVSIPASNTNKPRKIIVIKKSLTAGMLRPANSQIVRKISLADFEKLGANKSIKKITRNSSSTKVFAIESPNGSSAGKIRYTVKSVPQQPSRFVKFTKSSQLKTNTKIVVNKQNTIYRCQKCHLLFIAHSEYIDHIKEHKSHIVFNEKRIIRLEDVQKMNQYQCAQCNAGFPTLEKLSMHENRHKTEFACKYCDKKFLFLYRYKEHMLLHEAKKEKYMECKHCDKKFLKKERYDEHMEMHFPKDIYPCGVSEKKYPSHAAAMEHIKIAHSKRLPMKCGLCNYETFVKQNFEKHASMHLRYVEKLNTNTFYKCDQCPQSFREPSVLKNHKDHMHAF